MLDEINLTPTNSYIEITNNNDSILLRTWGNPNESKAIALLVHGLGAHSAWFEAFARLLKIEGIFVVSYDLVGFGKKRKHNFFSYSQWLDDLLTTYDYLKSLFIEKPIYILGNSMGALVSLAALSRIQPAIMPNGIVLLSPGLNGNPKIFTFSYKAISITKALLNPESIIDLPYSVDLVVRDANIRSWLDNDPDRRFSIPGKMVLELLKLTKRVEDLSSLPVPLLMMTAGNEFIVDNQKNIAYFNSLKAPQKDLLHFEQAYHDLVLDPEVDEVAKSFVSWQSQICLKDVISQ
jgi:alpha-beta hydrolase superfamily lysophospholipase